MRLEILALALALGTSGCFAGGGPFTEPRFPPSVGCVEGAPQDPALVLVVGTIEGQPFRELQDGVELAIDYGPQGGQHIYFSARVAGAQEGDQLRGRVESVGISDPVRALEQCDVGSFAEVRDLFVALEDDSEQEVTLTVSVLRCEAAGDSDYYDEGGTPPTVVAERSVRVSVVN